MVTDVQRSELRADLIADEGLLLKPYIDTVGKLTIGVGRNLTDRGISKDEAMMLFDHDLDAALADCASWPPFASLNPVRQRVVVNLRFNLGWTGLRQFKRFLKAIQEGDFMTASRELLASKWATQVKEGRAFKLAQMMATGVTVWLFACSAVFAQALPDRHETIHQLVQGKYAGQLDGTDSTGSRVLDLICADLNVSDEGNWGRLVKTDRNPPFVPYDILVWKPTREHVDVLTARDSVWIPHGVIPEAWQWLPCQSPSPLADRPPAGIVVPPSPHPEPIPGTIVPVPGPTDPAILAQILTELQAHEAADAAERAEAAAFREQVRTTWRNRFVLVAKYIVPAITAFVTGTKVKS